MNPKAIVFCCSWSSYPGLQLSQLPIKETDPEYKVIINMCAGRITPELILEAFQKGAWGVMIAGCPVDKCEHDGNYKTRRRILLTKRLLAELGIEPERLMLEWIDKGESQKFKDTVSAFIENMKNLGPIPQLS
jgi:coenzyme F420-reducing hydrogenase delta subunit